VGVRDDADPEYHRLLTPSLPGSVPIARDPAIINVCPDVEFASR
jgi:hypothetical protein